MKKFLLCFLSVAALTTARAQNYYSESTTLTADGITFSVESIYNVFYRLQNAENVYSHRPTEYLDGTNAEPWDYDPGEIDVESFKKAFTETFTEEEGARLRDGKDAIWVALVKNNRGEVLEVSFSARISPRTSAIPPSKYALYERNLKKYVRWKTITDDEKKLNIMHETRKLIFSYLVPRKIREPNPGDRVDSLVELK